jgi:phospholipid/cholesterol/gamma-HCH transport system permease protein
LSVAGSSDYELDVQRRGEQLALALRGRVEVGNAERLLTEIRTRLTDVPREVVLDLSAVDYFDSAGGAVLIRLRQELAGKGVALRIDRSTPAIDGFLSLVDQDALAKPPPSPSAPPSPPSRIGGATLAWVAEFREVVVFAGEVTVGLWQAALHPRQMRWRETLLYMQRAGSDGLPIVALISFLMGLITAFQAAVQMKQFGADIYVANLVGLSIVRELGPLMTAIIAAGRSGAAFAAEIGTMKVSEEVDALTTMGLDRTRFLVTPKVLALVLMMPCLTLFADLVGVVGGLTVSVFWLDMPVAVYLRQTRIAMLPWDVYSGLLKSVAFALLIASVGCLRGFQARGGAESVGRITTSAIVTSLFLIIVTDAVFTVVFHYW